MIERSTDPVALKSEIIEEVDEKVEDLREDLEELINEKPNDVSIFFNVNPSSSFGYQSISFPFDASKGAKQILVEYAINNSNQLSILKAFPLVGFNEGQRYFDNNYICYLDYTGHVSGIGLDLNTRSVIISLDASNPYINFYHAYKRTANSISQDDTKIIPLRIWFRYY